MVNSVLITLPDYETTVFYLSEWTKKLIKKLNTIPLKLEGKKVTRNNFESFIKKNNPNYIMLNGHGSENEVCGDNDEVILDNTSKIFKNKRIYARACSSAAKLGKKCIEKGGEMYAGYSLPFFFLTDTNYTSRPVNDPTAKHVLEWSNTTALAVLNGLSKDEIKEKSQIHYDKTIRHLKTHYNPEAQGIIACLEWNMKCQRILT